MSHLQVVKGGEVLGMGLADYIWLDDEGQVIWKKYVVPIVKSERGDPAPLIQRKTTEYCPCEDGCDCDGENSQTLILVPCHYLPDPTRPQPNFLVLCHVKDTEDQPVEWNSRAKLIQTMRERGDDTKLIWFGFSQGYKLGDARGPEYDDDPAHDFEERKFFTAERHLGACFDAALLIHSTSGYPGAVEFQFKVGVRGLPSDHNPDPPHALVVADHLVIARYLMEKIGAGKGLVADWRGLSVYLSSADMRGISSASVQRVEADLMATALDDMGEVRRLPHPERGGTQCIGVQRDDPGDPYKLAADVLAAIIHVEEDEDAEEEGGGGGGPDRLGEDDPEP